MGDSSLLEWLRESEDRTVFEGDVLRVDDDDGHTFDVQRGGWSFDRGPDTWLTHRVLARFEGHRVRITVEDLGQSPFMRRGSPT